MWTVSRKYNRGKRNVFTWGFMIGWYTFVNSAKAPLPLSLAESKVYAKKAQHRSGRLIAGTWAFWLSHWWVSFCSTGDLVRTSCRDKTRWRKSTPCACHIVASQNENHAFLPQILEPAWLLWSQIRFEQVPPPWHPSSSAFLSLSRRFHLDSLKGL